jgi:hypothetical protein
MASCPPPPKELKPPDVAPIDFLGGKYRLSGAIFYNPTTKKWNGSFYDQRSTQGPPSTGTTRDHREPPKFADPVVKAVLARVYRSAKIAWKNVAGDVKVTEMIDRGRTYGWTLRYGSLQALAPRANETVGQYRSRGGVPLAGAFLDGSLSIDRVLPPWVDKHDKSIENFHLHIQWSGRIGHAMVLRTRIETPGTMDKVGDTIARAIRWVCNKITNEKLMTAAAAATMVSPSPEMQAAIAAYMAAAALCNRAWPQCDPPGTGTVITPIQVSAVPVAPAYPQGTIAWLDKKVGQYRIAIPVVATAGLVPTHIETTYAAEAPPAATVVNRIAWESATRPWYRRSVVQGAAAVAGGLAAIGIVAVARR